MSAANPLKDAFTQYSKPYLGEPEASRKDMMKQFRRATTALGNMQLQGLQAELKLHLPQSNHGRAHGLIFDITIFNRSENRGEGPHNCTIGLCDFRSNNRITALLNEALRMIKQGDYPALKELSRA